MLLVSYQLKATPSTAENDDSLAFLRSAGEGVRRSAEDQAQHHGRSLLVVVGSFVRMHPQT